ncbi:hypothetical protein Tco_0878725 [Tanacetum coccineum]|uniref:Uncharacterized protein n=1 Tax=Tanacetum coccineum TaxID=301880 RepID=A0ABQ5C4L5_9ASTR
MRFLSRDTFSISFIRDPLSPVFDTLLPFSSENEEKVFNPGSLSSNEEKSPHLLSHRGFNPSKIISDFSKSPMMISGGDIPILDVPIAPDYEASRARGFVHRSLELHILSMIMGIQYPPIIENLIDENKITQEDGSKTKPEKKTVIPTAAKIEKPVGKPVKYAEMYMSQRPRGNQRTGMAKNPIS